MGRTPESRRTTLGKPWILELALSNAPNSFNLPTGLFSDHHVFRFGVRLHQPHRPLQQTQPGGPEDTLPKQTRFLSPTQPSSLYFRSVIQFVLPEMGAHAFLTLLFLLTGSWLALLLNLPLLGYHIKKVMDQKHLYDPTEIFRTLPTHKKECFIKLGFYLLCFFYYLYRWGSF